MLESAIRFSSLSEYVHDEVIVACIVKRFSEKQTNNFILSSL